MGRIRLSPVLRRTPFTMAIVLIVIGSAFATGTHLGPIAPSFLRVFGFAAVHLSEMEWHRMFTSLFLTTGGGAFYVSTVLLALFVGASEWCYGTRRTVAVFLGVHVMTLLVVSFALALPLASVGVGRGELLARARDVGPSAGYFGCLGFILAALPRRTRARACVTVFAILLVRFAWSFARVPDAGRQISADSAHLVALPLGFLAAHVRGMGHAYSSPRNHDEGS